MFDWFADMDEAPEQPEQHDQREGVSESGRATEAEGAEPGGDAGVEEGSPGRETRSEDGDTGPADRESSSGTGEEPGGTEAPSAAPGWADSSGAEAPGPGTDEGAEPPEAEVVSEARERSVHERVGALVCERLEVTDPDKQRAVGELYRAVRENAAPFVAKVTDDMLTDLRAEAEHSPDIRVVFLGRDGHSLAIAARRLDPAFYAAHGREVVLSRAVVEAAVQDLEVNAGREFPQIADFRAAGRKVDPASVDGARQRLTEYLQTAGVPAGEPGRRVVLVDTSFKGTVQEVLTAIYPQTRFEGRYIFHGASPHDPHPEAKKGYAVHLDADHSHGGRPSSGIPRDRTTTLSHQDMIGAVEETLHGPWSSPQRISRSGAPVQYLLRHESRPLNGLNPVKVAEPHKDPLVREAAKDAGLLAVAHYAEQIARQRANGADVDGDLRSGAERFIDRVRCWIRREPVDDPGLVTVLDSYVRRADKAVVNDLADAIGAARLRSDTAARIWAAYDDAGTSLETRRAFVTAFRHQYGLHGKEKR